MAAKTRLVNRRLAAAKLEPRAFQQAFFQRMQPIQQLLKLLDYLPDVDFFAKDAEGRFVAISKGTLRRIGVEREEDVLGKMDDFLHPPNVVKAIREDDLRVMRTREPMVDRVEALFSKSNAKDWFLTTKLPIMDESGKVIGIMGYVRPYHGGRGGGEDDAQLRRVVEYIHEHFRKRLSVSDLAKIAHLSERQLNRRFQQIFRMSTQEFLVRTRIQAASEVLLATDMPIGEIAVEHGFYDQSAFTRQFRHHLGETPLAYRRRRTRTRVE
jgi:AraC-like DNA-binding protein